MKQATIWIAATILAVVLWMLAASYLFLKMAGLWDLTDHPWWGWWTYINSDYHDFWTRLYLIVSAIVPTMVLIAIAAAVVRLRQKPARSMFGDSKWASDEEMRAGGIGQSKTLL